MINVQKIVKKSLKSSGSTLANLWISKVCQSSKVQTNIEHNKEILENIDIETVYCVVNTLIRKGKMAIVVISVLNETSIYSHPGALESLYLLIEGILVYKR